MHPYGNYTLALAGIYGLYPTTDTIIQFGCRIEYDPVHAWFDLFL